MDRITKKTEHIGFYIDMSDTRNAIERLGELEDKLESGELVEVVRCKNCNHWRVTFDNLHICDILGIDEYDIENINHFCSCGERKENK